MANIYVFSHYFAFAAVANYAASVYEKTIPLLERVVKRFNFSDLKKDRQEFMILHTSLKDFFEQYKANDASQNSVSENDPEKIQRKLKMDHFQLLHTGCEEALNRAERAETRLDFCLCETGLSKEFLNHFKLAVLPLFPLAGTFCVITVLISCLAEISEHFKTISLNAFEWTISAMTVIVVISIKWIRKKSFERKSFLISAWLIMISLIGLIVGAEILHNHYLIRWTVTNHFMYLLLGYAIILSGIPLIVVCWKSGRLFYSLNYNERVYQKANQTVKDSLTQIMLGIKE